MQPKNPTNERVKLIMGFGTFDGIHPGHLNYFEQLKTIGEQVIIVVARDKNVLRIKGKSPYFSEAERYNALKEIQIIDQVVLGDPDHFLKRIHEFKPNALGFGYDQNANLEKLKKEFPSIKLFRLKSFEPHQYKSSLLRKEKSKPQLRP